MEIGVCDSAGRMMDAGVMLVLLSLVVTSLGGPVKVPQEHGFNVVTHSKCLVDGSWYSLGEYVPADVCEYCQCGPGGRVLCLPKECKWPRCIPGDPVVRPPATCCAVCTSSTICGIFCPWPRCKVGEEVVHNPGQCCPYCGPILPPPTKY